MKRAAIIVAAGQGKRVGRKVPKQFLKIKGKAMFLWSANTFASIKQFERIIIVVPPNMVKFLTKKYKNKFEFVTGGKERFDSVKKGLSIIGNDIDFVAIHDASRPLINKKDILSVLKEAEKTKAAIAVEKTKDTIKIVSDKNQILKTLNRTILRNAQTPQIFERKLIKEAYQEKIASNTTDDAQLVERLKIKISAIETKFANFKVSTKEDFRVIEKLLK
ncbi:MAG: 2-C-methyl-D-erythritol 4-phosphate cytidylyltransferase [Endomicrobium sp.]|jgi:2-C-methyl-D-erythritol 4-phosphate cytidylyltransferase|nr:2-C-methyl-D-erythritol 4-phosphate cytidylyltransferase [Endomicrobium sp.]